MSLNSVFRSLQGQIKRKTEKAVLFQPMPDDLTFREAAWFPLSQLSSLHEAYDEINGTFDVLMASEWILGQKGFLSIAGAAGYNPVTSVAVVKPQAPKPVTPKSDGQKRHDHMAYNRLPYKDDESPVFGDDDIPF